jgi:NAD+ kinase
MMPLDLVLVRHGQSEGNLAKRRSEDGDHTAFTEEFRNRHSSSFRLSKLGQRQALLTGEWIRNEFCKGKGSVGFDRYITSEHVRAMETAARMNLPNANWYQDVYLTERNWGDLDICPENERKEKFGEALHRREVEPFFWKPPNGESFLELCLRVDRVLHTLHRECSDKRVIIVCHGEVMRAFQVRLERMSQNRFKTLTFSDEPVNRIYNCQIMHYTRRDPWKGNLAKHANWVRTVRVSDNIWTTCWGKILRPTYSNKELLEEIERVPVMVS